MRQLITISLALSITLLSCNGQTKATEKQKADNLPQTNIKVNKEYDKNGKIIKYDSTYSSYYSNIKTDSNLKDSIYEKPSFFEYNSLIGNTFKIRVSASGNPRRDRP